MIVGALVAQVIAVFRVLIMRAQSYVQDFTFKERSRYSSTNHGKELIGCASNSFLETDLRFARFTFVPNMQLLLFVGGLLVIQCQLLTATARSSRFVTARL